LILFGLFGLFCFWIDETNQMNQINQTNQTNQTNKPRWLIVFSILFALLATTTVLLNMPPLTECRSEAPAVESQHWFRATQVVVQPWRGRHHVYGVFGIPVSYKRDRLYRAKLVIHGFSKEFAEVSSEGGDKYNDRDDSENYEKRVYLPTRTALWFLLIGRFGDLKIPCHWWLVIADRAG
jgi:hypothetical protein